MVQGDIVDVVAQYTNLQKVGARFFGTCPFCAQATALRVDPLEQLFKCFACDKAGDAADFAALVATGG